MTKTLLNSAEQLDLNGESELRIDLVLMKRKASALILMIMLSFSIMSISFVHFTEANGMPAEKMPSINHVYVKSDFTLTGNSS